MTKSTPKILLVYLPFCTPASPPYSLTNLHAFLRHNYQGEVDVLDLNIEFHKRKFPLAQKYFQQGDFAEYASFAKKFSQEFALVSSKNNKQVVLGESPELLDELLALVLKKQPDVVACSLVYSSQAFYAQALLKNLPAHIKTVIGGPAVNSKIDADITLHNEIDLLEFLGGDISSLDFSYVTDYTLYPLADYFTPKVVLPFKTSIGCYYNRCTFCSHHGQQNYVEFPLAIIVKNIVLSKQEFIFLIDDMLYAKRLLDFAERIKPHNIKWACQLRPTTEFTREVLQELYASGLRMVIWGVESGSQRILDLMKKGTKIDVVARVLAEAKQVGIRNVTYIMFGFPTETKDEFLATIQFLEHNQSSIDLVSTSVFGLQKDTEIFLHPERFGVSSILQEERTVLEPKITFTTTSGLSRPEVMKLKNNYKKTLEKINKFPKEMNFFREHMICYEE